MFDLDKNQILTLVSAVTLLAAACIMHQGDVIENYGMMSFVPTAAGSYSSSPQAMAAGNIYATPPTFQALIPPRMYGGQMPASITFNMPNSKNMAFDSKSPFVGMDGPSPCVQSRGGRDLVPAENTLSSSTMPTLEGYKEGYAGQTAEAPMNLAQPDLMPMNQSMAMAAAEPLPDGPGLPANPVVFDSFMAVNRNSRTRGQGCMFRGDLPIIPCKSGWFQVSARPNVDLQEGAMNVMGGTFNTTANELASLINMASGGATTNISGVDMSNDINTCLKGAGQDVVAVAFP
jgi:hypothetical protein